jgi:hypothetical protein
MPPTVAERIARCPQTIFDPIVRRVAQSVPGVTLRYRTRCESVTQDASGVTALVTDLDDPRNYLSIARPGSGAPHFWLDENVSVLGLFGRGLVLLRLGSAPPSSERFETAAARTAVPLRTHALSHQHLLALYDRRLVLVRPDGHVAWRGGEPPGDCDAVLNVVRGAA